MIKVAIVEDDARIRKVVTEVLASAKDSQCVGAFADGATYVRRICEKLHVRSRREIIACYRGAGEDRHG